MGSVFTMRIQLSDGGSACSSHQQLASTPVNMHYTSVQMNSMPEQMDCTPVHTNSTPVQMDFTPVHTNSTPVQMDHTPVQMSLTPYPMDSKHQIDPTPVQQTNPTQTENNDTPQQHQQQQQKQQQQQQSTTVTPPQSLRYTPYEVDSWYKNFAATITKKERDTGTCAVCSEKLDPHPHKARPAKLEAVLAADPVDTSTQYQHAWNAHDCSKNIYIKSDDPLTLHRYPVAQATDAIRGRVGYSKGFHVWEILWKSRQRGTHAIVGVGTSAAKLHGSGYHSLVGGCRESWGWDLGRNLLHHRSHSMDSGGVHYVHEPDFRVPDSFLVVLDMDEGTLSFVVDDRYLGVAFTGLKGRTVYPMVSLVWGHCEITMTYVGALHNPHSLKALCRESVRAHATADPSFCVNYLPIPKVVKEYIINDEQS